jgi:hypothetical protein
MRKHLAWLAALAVLGLAWTANAKPVKLSKAQLDNVVAGTITPTKQNGGGNTPGGQANGVPTVNLNPAGKAPGGHN